MRHWRGPTWLIAIWTVLIAAWIVGGAQAAKIDNDAKAAGAGIAVFIIIFIYVLVLIPMAFLWFGTRPRSS